MARRKSTTDPDDPSPSFEEALAGLESIVEAMENEQLPLEELVSRYEQGSKLLERCESVLQSARERIELITLRARSGETTDSGDLTGDPAPADDDDHDDDIRLF